MENEKNKNTQQNAGGSDATATNSSVSSGTQTEGAGVSGASAQRASDQADAARSAGGTHEGAEQGGEQGLTSSVTEAATDSAQGLLEKAKGTAGQAYEAVSEKAVAKLDEQKATVTSGLASVAGSIKQVGESLSGAEDQTGLTEVTAKYSNRLAEQIEQVSNYFEQNDIRGIVSDVEDFARRNPAVFIGGAFALGMLAARFLKSSKPAGQGMEAPAGRTGTDTAGRQSSGRSNSTGSGGRSQNAGAGGSESDNVVGFESGGASNKNTSSTRESIKNPM